VYNCPVIAKKAASNISQEPEMKELKEVFNQMTYTEKARTINRMKPSSYFVAENRGRGGTTLPAFTP
jgi:hypothetical protein